jgi:hypothetical protein
MAELPIVCALSTPELRERRAGLLRRVRERLEAARPLAGGDGDWDGYELRFPGDEETVAEVLELVRLESRCCAFLRFRVTLEPGGGAVTLEVSGPPGGAEILAAELLPGDGAGPGGRGDQG